MNPWLQSSSWADVVFALLVWLVVLAFVAWLFANLTTRPPRHH